MIDAVSACHTVNLEKIGAKSHLEKVHELANKQLTYNNNNNNNNNNNKNNRKECQMEFQNYEDRILDKMQISDSYVLSAQIYIICNSYMYSIGHNLQLYKQLLHISSYHIFINVLL